MAPLLPRLASEFIRAQPGRRFANSNGQHVSSSQPGQQQTRGRVPFTMASFSSLFQDNGTRSRCDSDASNFSESSKRKAREDFSPAAKSSRVDLVELEDCSSAEDSQSTEENLMALEGMINRVQAIFEKLKVNIEEADLNPKLSAILTDMCSALTITNTAQVQLIGLAKTRSLRHSRSA
jgi:hypothetical protein